MKINITFDEPLVDGADHLQFNTLQSNDQRIRSINELWTLVDDGEVSHIRVSHFIDYIPLAQQGEFFTRLSRKLAHGGQLTIIGTDCYSLAKAYMNGQIDLNRLNVERLGKSSLATNTYVVDVLKQLGLKITQRKLEGITYCVVGERI